MRLSLQKSTGRWRLGEMQEIHLDFLRMAADDASMGDCPGGRERLFPPPLAGAEELLDAEFNDEWRELIAPEMEMQFAGDVGVFLSDLDSVRPVRKTGDAAVKLHRLDVPLAHGRAWFSTLNQARLLMESLSIETTGGADLARAAAQHYRSLRAQGITVRSAIDVLVASYCIENDYALLHRDCDFDAFEHLRGLRAWRQ